MAYAGYRGDETPRTLVVKGRCIQVTGVVARWTGTSRTERVLRRFFRVTGDDGMEHTVFVDQDGGQWHQMAEPARARQNIDRNRPV